MVDRLAEAWRRLAEQRDRLFDRGLPNGADCVDRQIERIRWQLALEMARQEREPVEAGSRTA